MEVSFIYNSDPEWLGKKKLYINLIIIIFFKNYSDLICQCARTHTYTYICTIIHKAHLGVSLVWTLLYFVCLWKLYFYVIKKKHFWFFRSVWSCSSKYWMVIIHIHVPLFFLMGFSFFYNQLLYTVFCCFQPYQYDNDEYPVF